jgi:hypothetical protein
MSYSTIDKPTDYFNTVTYTGSAGGQTISGVGNQPDFIWVKQLLDAGYDHSLHNSVSGVLKQLISNSTSAEITNTDTVTSTNADGFVLGADTAGPNANSNNQDGKTYVAWNWKAGTAFTNDASSTGIGTIDSTGSVSDTAGFSIVSYTGTGSNGTIKHGLSTAPRMYITKSLSSARSWAVYNQNIGNTKALFLNSTDAQDTDATYWNSTSPTASVLSLGTRSEMNHSGENFIAYCFAEKQGYSKFGSYTGNGNADGPFVYTGFKPAFVICKKSSSTGDWELYDNKRNGFNGTTTNGGNVRVYPNANDAEGGTGRLSLLSNSFKITNSSGNLNGSGNSFIYMAFAENPFVGSNFVPTTAR